MTSTSTSHCAPQLPTVPPAARVSMALGGAVLAGVGTSYGQGITGLSGLSNAAGPWFLVAVALLLLVRVRGGRFGLPVAMVSGIVLLELLHVGYWATSNLRGFPDYLAITNFWVLMGIPAGVLAGAVAVAVRSADVRWRSTALGVTAAVLVGEGVRGLLQVADTTGVGAWVVEIVLGVVVLGAGLVVGRSLADRAAALGAAVLGTIGVLGAYLLLS
jgi:hypothetical protein